ncbi:MAG: AAA family ATPase [Muribaculaceae bacterium]|nr:AAA family ATPase [Muribaculaceae bacterium]
MNPIKILNNHRRLLQLEYEEEKKAFSDATNKIGLLKLAERGEAWIGISVGKTFYNSLNQRCVEILRKNTDEEHHFEYGRPVAFFASTGDYSSSSRVLFTGTVNFVDEARMIVIIPEAAVVSRLAEAAEASVMLSFDETSYRVMFEAIERAINAKGRLAELRDIIYGAKPTAELHLSPLHFPYLNESQSDGVNKVLRAKDVAVLHGPPGTGKTTTLVEAINETLRRESQVLVCAQSNMAVDWISEKLVDRGINVLRIGNPSRVNDKMLSFTYERRFESHPDYPTLWAIRKNIRELRKGRQKNNENRHQKLDSLQRRATELEIRINNDLFNSAHVIASTLTGSANRLLSGMKFSTVFIDEAAQALQAATLIPLRRAGRMILAGDHCQLPPTVKCFEAQRQGLGKSLMEILVATHPDCVTLLTTQYRMNESIMKFSSEWFYNNEMKAAPDVRFRSILDFDKPIDWVDTSDTENLRFADIPEDKSKLFFEEKPDEKYGRINKEEAELSLEVLKNYIYKIGKQRLLEERLDIGVISPYRAQVKHLRKLVAKSPFFRPFIKLISINTVDGFQGQERDIILLSLVRSNENGEIGFLRDLRRMNVAMTRARMKLIIIGNASTLSHHPFYDKLKKYIRRINDNDFTVLNI